MIYRDEPGVFLFFCGVFLVGVFAFVFVLVFFIFYLSPHFPGMFWCLGFKRTLTLETVVSTRRARTGR